MKKNNGLFGKILMTLMIVFFYLPILYMIVFSFNEGKSLTSFSGFSLRWYKHMLESGDMMEALYTTFGVALIATFVATVADVYKRQHKSHCSRFSYFFLLIFKCFFIEKKNLFFLFSAFFQTVEHTAAI